MALALPSSMLAKRPTPGISSDQDSMSGPVATQAGATNAPGASPPATSAAPGAAGAPATFGSTPAGSSFWNGGSATAPSSDNGSTEKNLSTTGRMADATLQAGQQAGQDRNQFEQSLAGGQGALNNYITSAVSAAMPSFNAQVQDMQENAARRGVSNGDLETSYEGDLSSAFQRNIANAAGQQSMNLYGTQLGAEQKQLGADTADYGSGLAENEDIRQGRKNANKGALSGLLGGAGTLAGGLLGGPAGAAAGGSIGGSLGSMFGG